MVDQPVPCIPVSETHPPNTPCSLMPASVHLPLLFLLPSTPSWSYLPGKGLVLLLATAQRAQPLRRASPSCPATPQGADSRSIITPYTFIYSFSKYSLSTCFAGKMKMRETWSRLGALTESSRFLSNFIPLLRDVKLSLQNVPPLVHRCPYAFLLRTVFLSPHQSALDSVRLGAP